jgi:hypothetical protein
MSRMTYSISIGQLIRVIYESATILEDACNGDIDTTTTDRSNNNSGSTGGSGSDSGSGSMNMMRESKVPMNTLQSSFNPGPMSMPMMMSNTNNNLSATISVDQSLSLRIHSALQTCDALIPVIIQMFRLPRATSAIDLGYHEVLTVVTSLIHVMSRASVIITRVSLIPPAELLPPTKPTPPTSASGNSGSVSSGSITYAPLIERLHDIALTSLSMITTAVCHTSFGGLVTLPTLSSTLRRHYNSDTLLSLFTRVHQCLVTPPSPSPSTPTPSTANVGGTTSTIPRSDHIINSSNIVVGSSSLSTPQARLAIAITLAETTNRMLTCMSMRHSFPSPTYNNIYYR